MTQSDGPGGVVEELLEVRVVHDLAGAEGVALAEQVLASQLDGVDPEAVGHHVHDPLRGPYRLHRPVAAEGAAGRKVGVDAVGVDCDMIEAVRADAGVSHLLRHSWPAVGVGTGVDVGPDPLGDKRAVVLGAEADSHGGGMSGHLVEDFVAVKDAPHGPTCQTRCEGGDCLDADEGLGAKRAAHGRDDDADVLG